MSQDKISKGMLYRQSIIVIQVYTKQHENLFISICSFHKESSIEFVLNRVFVKTSFIEKMYFVGTHWNCLYALIPVCTNNICF